MLQQTIQLIDVALEIFLHCLAIFRRYVAAGNLHWGTRFLSDLANGRGIRIEANSGYRHGTCVSSRPAIRNCKRRESGERRDLLFEQIFEGFSRVVRTTGSERRRCRCRVSHRRGILLNRHAKLKERAIVLRVLLRDALWNRLRTFKLASRIEVHALLARMHRGVAARAFTLLIEAGGQHGPAA